MADEPIDDFREEAPPTKVYDPTLLGWLLGYARPHALLLAFCVALLLAGSAAQLAQPYLVKVAIDGQLTSATGSLGGLIKVGALMLLAVLASAIIGYFQGLLIQSTGQRIIARIRQDVFGHLLRLDLAYFDRNPVGRLVTRVTNDTEALNEMYTSVLVNAFRDVFAIAGTVVVMFRLEWRLALVGLTILPLVAGAAFTFKTLAREAWRVLRVRLARINATLAENLSGIRLILANNWQEQSAREFQTINEALFDASWTQLTINAWMRPLLDLLSQIALAATLWYGGSQAIGHVLEIGTLYAFTSYLRQLYNPLSEVAEKFNILQAAIASSERLFALLEVQPTMVATAVGPDLPEAAAPQTPAAGAFIEFSNVSFAYLEPPGDAAAVPPAPSPQLSPGGLKAQTGRCEPVWVLKDVSFRVDAGQTLAFVGHTGAGKSSIMSLIERFYDVQHGQILVEGKDIKQWPLSQLRRRFAIVLQEPFLFCGTIRDNINLWGQDLEDSQVEAYLREAGGEHLLATLPQGVGTKVAERGGTLSVGERQIVAFARALAAKPDLLILDEATASVDSVTEAILQAALLRRFGKVTILLVAHRLATVQHADRIVVLHKGRVKETGTHQELLAMNGLYYKLWRLQATPVSASDDTNAAAMGYVAR